MRGSAKGEQVRRDTPRRHRRPLGVVMHAPQTLRALVRADEIGLVVLSAIVGSVAGIVGLRS